MCLQGLGSGDQRAEVKVFAQLRAACAASLGFPGTCREGGSLGQAVGTQNSQPCERRRR